MKSLMLLLTVFFGVGFFPNARADGAIELLLNAGNLGIASSAMQVAVGPGIEFAPFSKIPWLQVGGEFNYERISYEGSVASDTLILAGFTANVGPVPLDAVFISLGFAKRSGSAPTADGGTEPNGSGFYFLAGKRIPISGSFSLRPSLGMVSCGTSGMIFRPFAVSYYF